MFAKQNFQKQEFWVRTFSSNKSKNPPISLYWTLKEKSSKAQYCNNKYEEEEEEKGEEEEAEEEEKEEEEEEGEEEENEKEK